MSDPNNPERIPLGDDMYIDTSRFVVGNWSLSDESRIANECHRRCNPDAIAAEAGQMAVAQFCMQNAMQGGGAQETIIDIRLVCNGPKRRLLSLDKKCGAKIDYRQVALPITPEEDSI